MSFNHAYVIYVICKRYICTEQREETMQNMMSCYYIAVCKCSNNRLIHSYRVLKSDKELVTMQSKILVNSSKLNQQLRNVSAQF